MLRLRALVVAGRGRVGHDFWFGDVVGLRRPMLKLENGRAPPFGSDKVPDRVDVPACNKRKRAARP